MSKFEAGWSVVDRRDDGSTEAQFVADEKHVTAAALPTSDGELVTDRHERRRPSVRTGKRWRVIFAACLLSLLSACGAKSEEDNTAMGSINGYNSTDQAITPFYVNSYGGVKMNAYSGGGSVCCVIYPKKWHPGLTAKVKWATSSGKSDGDPTLTWHEAEVPIEPYDISGRMNVHFLPDNKVRILIFNGTPRAEGYKGPPYPEAPPDWSVRSSSDDADMPPVPAAPKGESQ
ncbi:DUF3304 domain-containing protein [Stenotrophomonas sp. SY1]|uniref:DUF3304 domain-containing protein n=1 Tax=Stenotrophomonas sp. SY1 TaxID=477235 RepID=UPI001E5F7145|nr:DUF3304 domain-containing protein [Stenotrophomonas sp. SY1]MCD9087069.1 DUF3304 domain-containing protein [Stenotrophomonas sp. SY1]